MDTLACTITDQGITAPVYADIVTSLTESYKAIFGSDAYLAPDSQDGQLLAIFAKAISDSNAATIQTFNAYSPQSAKGTALSNAVKLNGIRRLAASYSQVQVLITGVNGTEILNGQVQDSNGVIWNLPASVVIFAGGGVMATATCSVLGSIQAPAGSISQIASPTVGWSGVMQMVDATPGDPVETDSELRLRQQRSVSYPSIAVIESISAGLANYSEVQKVKVYENSTGAVDVNGIPGHSIYCVTYGGGPTEIAYIIGSLKPPGTGTYGINTIDVWSGNTVTPIRFSPADTISLNVAVTVNALTGYTTSVGLQMKQNIIDYINTLDIGSPVYNTSLIAAAVGPLRHVTALTACIAGGALSTADITLGLRDLPQLVAADITITVV